MHTYHISSLPAVWELLSTLEWEMGPLWFRAPGKRLADTAPVFGIGGPIAEAIALALSRMLAAQRSNSCWPSKAEDLQVTSETGQVVATLRQNAPGGFWVIESEEWGSGCLPHFFLRHATQHLIRSTKYDAQTCSEAITVAIALSYHDWRDEQQPVLTKHGGAQGGYVLEDDDPLCDFMGYSCSPRKGKCRRKKK